MKTGTPSSDIPGLSRSAQLVGRREVMAELRRILLAAKEGTGSTVALTGPGGIGKTSLLRWLDEEARGEGFAVRMGFCLQGIDAPFFAFEQVWGASSAIRDPPESPAGSRAAAAADDDGARLAAGPAQHASMELRPQETGALPGRPLPFLGQADDEIPPSVTLLRYREELAQASSQRPFLLLLDDLQWADPQSLQALQFLARNLSELRAFVVVALRDDPHSLQGTDPAEGPTVGETIDQLVRERTLRRFSLSPFTRGEVRRLVANALGGGVVSGESEAMLQILTERSGGIPYYVEELLQQLRSEGYVERVRGGWKLRPPESWKGARRSGEGPRAPIPLSLQRLLRAKVSPLSPSERRVLEVGAVVGLRFDLEAVAAVTGLGGAETESVSRKLSEGSPLLVPPGGGGASWSFVHPLLWEYLLHELAPGSLRRISQDLATWWEVHRPQEIGRIAGFYHAAGDARRGPPSIRRALEHARRSLALDQVETYLGWLRELLLEQGTSTALVVEEQLFIVDALRSLGGFEHGRRVLEGLTDLPIPPPLRGEVLVRLADLVKNYDPERSQRLLTDLEQGTSVAGLVPYGTLLGRIRVAQAYLRNEQMDYSKSLELGSEALSLLGPKGDPYERSRVLSYRASALANLGRFEEAAAASGGAQEIAENAGLMGILEQAKVGAAYAQLARGHVREAHEDFLAATSLARRSGHIPLVVHGLLCDCLSLLELGRSDEARSFAEEAKLLARQFGMQRYVAEAEGTLAAIALRRGDTINAVRHGKIALGLSSGMGEGQRVSFRLTLIRAYAARGEGAAALRELSEVLPPGTDPKSASYPDIALTGAEALEANGRSEEARAFLEASLSRSREMRLPLIEADSLLALAVWEERHGGAAASSRRRKEAEAMLAPLSLSLHGRPPPLLSTLHASRRPRPSRSERRTPGLSTGDLVLLHLQRNLRHSALLSDGGAAPVALTQEGIGEELGLSQGRLAAPLQRLVQRGLVKCAVCHVQGFERRRKAYALTRKGLLVAKGLQPRR
ncbi:MAG: AAA family ATPase [Euryarchaeota archaeon]|nr:AAA family ATPase [Euryarchaeota archaeon]